MSDEAVRDTYPQVSPHQSCSALSGCLVRSWPPRRRGTWVGASCAGTRWWCTCEPQAFDLLVYLVKHRDRVVPKHELLDGCGVMRSCRRRT